MRAGKLLLAVVAATLLLCAVGWTGYAQRAGAKRPTWEYTTVIFPNQGVDNEAFRMMNDLGARGWELVGVTEVGGIPTCFYKRQK
jgi:hypothetical protein